MKHFKRWLAVLLAAVLLFTTFLPAFAQPADTETQLVPGFSDDPIRREIKNLSELIPEGYHVTNLYYSDESEKTVFYIEGEPSAYGYIPYMWVDALGNEIPPEAEPFVVYDEPVAAGGTYPAYYDARTYDLITPTEHQIGGTCWAHAAAACIEANAIFKGYADAQTINVSEYQMVWNGLNGYYDGVSDSANDGAVSASIPYMLDRGGNATYISPASYAARLRKRMGCSFMRPHPP